MYINDMAYRNRLISAFEAWQYIDRNAQKIEYKLPHRLQDAYFC